jgi:translation initiation factor 5B
MIASGMIKAASNAPEQIGGKGNAYAQPRKRDLKKKEQEVEETPTEDTTAPEIEAPEEPVEKPKEEEKEDDLPDDFMDSDEEDITIKPDVSEKILIDDEINIHEKAEATKNTVSKKVQKA